MRWSGTGAQEKSEALEFAGLHFIALFFVCFSVLLRAQLCVFYPAFEWSLQLEERRPPNTNRQRQSVNMVRFKRVLLQQLHSRSGAPVEEAAGCIQSPRTYFRSTHAPVNNNVVSKSWHDLQRCLGSKSQRYREAIMWTEGWTWQMRHDPL